MVDKIKVSLEDVLKNTAWMENTTRQAALEKLKAMSLLNTLPEQGYDDESMEDEFKDMIMSTKNYYKNKKTIDREELKSNLEKLRQPTERSDSAGDTSVMNAKYYKDRNQIGTFYVILYFC
ncbi:endothelin-converting enzyme 1 [Elysia marginata]|uniref:Endothelin-converting enzyme 1 n=1 Tax=Elysia marginata TaxID=1093978 RepID=A0AAV4GNA0_9GAST|nr:endothelin-converting enzyme 1 [Elysia marginata]